MIPHPDDQHQPFFPANGAAPPEVRHDTAGRAPTCGLGALALECCNPVCPNLRRFRRAMRLLRALAALIDATPVPTTPHEQGAHR